MRTVYALTFGKNTFYWYVRYRYRNYDWSFFFFEKRNKDWKYNPIRRIHLMYVHTCVLVEECWRKNNYRNDRTVHYCTEIDPIKLYGYWLFFTLSESVKKSEIKKIKNLKKLRTYIFKKKRTYNFMVLSSNSKLPSDEIFMVGSLECKLPCGTVLLVVFFNLISGIQFLPLVIIHTIELVHISSFVVFGTGTLIYSNTPIC